jgi:hypothetical protein
MMAETFQVFLGVDITSGPRPVTFVALDPDEKALAIGEGDLPDVLAYAAGQQAGALVAVNAPGRPNNGRMALAEVRQALKPEPERGKWKTLRQADYELISLGASLPQTPASAEHSMPWMKRGFTLVERLEELGYRTFTAQPAGEEAVPSPRRWLEAQADAGFWSLLGVNPLQSGTLEGRIQRQLVLADEDLDVPDAMEFFEEITRFKLLKGNLPLKYVLSQGEINAWLAAHTAWLAAHEPKRVRHFGAEEEGVIFIPCKE